MPDHADAAGFAHRFLKALHPRGAKPAWPSSATRPNFMLVVVRGEMAELPQASIRKWKFSSGQLYGRRNFNRYRRWLRLFVRDGVGWLPINGVGPKLLVDLAGFEPRDL